MRRFIYFDSDNLNSYLAQIEKGLIQSNVNELQKGKTQSSTDEEQTSIVGDIGAKVLGIGANIKSELNSTNSSTNISNEFIKNIKEKVLHDYAFDKVLQYLKNNDLIKDKYLSVGDFIISDDKMTLLDFDYFSTLFSDSGVYKFSYEMKKRN